MRSCSQARERGSSDSSGQLGVQRRPAPRGRLGLQLAADLGVGGGHVVQPFAQGLEIQQRATHQQWPVAAGADLRCQPLHVFDEPRRRVRLVGFDDVDQVVRHALALGRARLGSANVHAAVDQRRVDADDLRAQRLGQFQRDGRLAAGRRTGQRQALQRVERPPAHGAAPRVQKLMLRSAEHCVVEPAWQTL